jgi:hypothetical protein
MLVVDPSKTDLLAPSSRTQAHNNVLQAIRNSGASLAVVGA